MTPQRWSRIKEVFLAAREVGEMDRAGYLDSVCGDDRGLRAEVELLLTNDCASSLPRPALDLEGFASQFASGQMLGQYRIEAPSSYQLPFQDGRIGRPLQSAFRVPRALALDP